MGLIRLYCMPSQFIVGVTELLERFLIDGTGKRLLVSETRAALIRTLQLCGRDVIRKHECETGRMGGGKQACLVRATLSVKLCKGDMLSHCLRFMIWAIVAARRNSHIHVDVCVH